MITYIRLKHQWVSIFTKLTWGQMAIGLEHCVLLIFLRDKKLPTDKSNIRNVELWHRHLTVNGKIVSISVMIRPLWLVGCRSRKFEILTQFEARFYFLLYLWSSAVTERQFSHSRLVYVTKIMKWVRFNYEFFWEVVSRLKEFY